MRMIMRHDLRGGTLPACGARGFGTPTTPQGKGAVFRVVVACHVSKSVGDGGWSTPDARHAATVQEGLNPMPGFWLKTVKSCRREAHEKKKGRKRLKVVFPKELASSGSSLNNSSSLAD